MKDNVDYAKIIKAKINLVDFLSKDLRLIKSGSNYKALCPFHNEKTPSFTINQEKNSFNCFGCGVSGDIFSYVMEKYKIDFKEALKILANEAGVNLKNTSYSSLKKSTENKAKYLHIMNLISNFYNENLKKNYLNNEHINTFLKTKNIDTTTIEKFHLGYSEDFLGVIKFLNKKGFDDQTLTDLNIFKKNSNNKIYDVYSKRIIFPIKDKLNNTIGFGGRILEGNGPKYINSSENEFFKKRFLLYNMNNLKNIKSKLDKLFIVEGYTDVIAMEKAGFNSVAPLGTAVSQEQLNLAWQYNNEPIIFFDGDQAGKNASIRVLDIALQYLGVERSLSFIFPDNSEDPDTILNKTNGKDIIKSLLENKSSYIETLIKSELIENMNTPERILLFKKSLSNKINKIENTEIKNLYKYIMNEKIQESLKESIKKTDYNPVKINKDHQFIKKYKDRKEEQFVLRRERSILGAMINNFNLLKNNDEILAEIHISNNELSILRDNIIEIISKKDINESLELKESLINKGLSQIIKRHFNTRDCIQFSLIENYANEKTNINNANKAFMDIINIQEEWYKRKNKNLSNTT